MNALEEHAVVADEIDDGHGALVACLAETAAELLQEHDARLGGTEHHDAIDSRDVDAFVEHVDGADGIELAGFELVERVVARVGAVARKDGVGARAVSAQPVAHVDGVSDAAAEDERA